jgi:hypothetical protein
MKLCKQFEDIVLNFSETDPNDCNPAGMKLFKISPTVISRMT